MGEGVGVDVAVGVAVGFFGLALLHAHVDLARLVGADEQGRQADVRRSHRLDLVAQAGDDLVAQAIAVEQDRPARSPFEIVAHLGHLLSLTPCRPQERPMISPSSSKSIREAAGALARPGIVLIAPQIG